jgi:hypothetical protein
MAGGRHDCWIARVIVALSETVFVVSDGNSVVGLDGSCSRKGKASCTARECCGGGRRPDARRVEDARRRLEWPR